MATGFKPISTGSRSIPLREIHRQTLLGQNQGRKRMFLYLLTGIDMYGLPKDINLAFFCGKTLLQACFGAHDFIMNLDGGISLTVTSSIGCIISEGEIRKFEEFRHAAPMLLALVGRVILSAKGDEAGTLTLRFDGGGIISIYDDSKEYESYIINNGGSDYCSVGFWFINCETKGVRQRTWRHPVFLN